MTDMEECWARTGPLDVRWLEVHKGESVYRSRLAARGYKPKSKVGDVERDASS